MNVKWCEKCLKNLFITNKINAFTGFIILLLFVAVTETVRADHDDAGLQLTAEENKWISENPEVTFTGDPNWLPYEAFKEDGSYVGIVADHLKLIEKSTSLTFKHIPVSSWTESLRIATEGKVSVISGDAADVILNKQFSPVDHYSRNPIVIIMDVRQHYVEKLEEIKNKKIAIIKDYGYTSDIFKTYIGYNFVEVENIQEGLSGVAEGRFDAMLATMALASYTIAEMGLHDIKVVGKTSIVMDLTLFIEKKQPLLHSIISKALKSISKSDSHLILQNWIQNKYVEKTDYTLAYQVAGIALLLLAIFVYWNNRLSREVELRFKTEDELKSAEDVLSMSHQRLLMHRENTPLGAIEFNTKFEVVEWNHAAEKIFGFTKKEINGQHIAGKIVPENFSSAVSKVMKALINGSGGERSTNENITKDGRVILCDWYNTPLIDSEGNVTGIASLVDDVTEKREAEKEKEQDRARFEAMFESIPDAIIYADPDRKIRMVNQSAVSLFGYEESELTGEQTKMLYVTDDDYQKTGKQRFSQGAETQNIPYQMIYRRKDNSVFNGETLGVSVKSSKGEVLGYLGIIRDITERTHVEAALKSLAAGLSVLEFEAFMNDVLERLTNLYGCRYGFIGLLEKDKSNVQTIAVRVNGEVADNFKYSLQGTPCSDILDQSKELIPRDASKIYAEDQMLVDMEVESYFGAPLISSSGETIGLISVMDVKPLGLDEWTEPVLGVFATRVALELERNNSSQELQKHRSHLEDLVKERTSSLVAARDEAERANTAKSDFLSRMSHELRTPMNAILGFGQLLEMGSDQLDDTQSGSVKEIMSAGYHLLELIDEILDLSKIESGNLSIEIEEVAVEDLMAQCVKFISHDADHRQISIINHVTNKNYFVKADRGRLRQIFLNLLSNAVKYNLDNGTIKIDYEVMGESVFRVSISDSGEGLTEEEVNMLFTPFERLNTKNNVDGTGIGLVITRHLAELMGGSVGVSSTPGVGSVFWVDLKLENK